MRLAALSLAVVVLVAAPERAGAAGLERLRLLDVTLADAPAPAPAPEPEPVRRSLAWAFLPFGVGQFANDSPVKGAIFCVAEALAFGTFAVTLGAFESKKIAGPLFGGGTFADADKSLAKQLEITYLIAFWTGVALAAVGIVDAIVFRPSAQTEVALGPAAVAVRF
jgi:hypothetical protein